MKGEIYKKHGKRIETENISNPEILSTNFIELEEESKYFTNEDLVVQHKSKPDEPLFSQNEQDRGIILQKDDLQFLLNSPRAKMQRKNIHKE